MGKRVKYLNNKKQLVDFTEIQKFESELNACMKCGFCTFWCPVYQEEKIEAGVARGKNFIIKSLIAGDLTYSANYSDLISKCTLCMRCTAHCPTGVKTADLMVAARADNAKKNGTTFPNNLIYKWILPHRNLFGKIVQFSSWLQNVFPFKNDGSIRHLPLFIPAILKGRYIPAIAPKFLRQTVPEVNNPTQSIERPLTVGFFTGCMTDFVFPDTGKTIIDFLNNNDVKVVVPKAQCCCGAPALLGAGDFETSRKMADANVQAFADVDMIIADCATCSSVLKDYAKYLSDSPERHEEYTKFANKILDVTVFLTDVLELSASAYKISPKFKGKRITWHDPCHLCRHQGVVGQPRRILESISDIQYIEMPDADHCCGMAGTFSLSHYQLSKKIADKKNKAIESCGADIVVTGCPGCIVQLVDTSRRNNNSVKIMHIMDLFAADK